MGIYWQFYWYFNDWYSQYVCLDPHWQVSVILNTIGSYIHYAILNYSGWLLTPCNYNRVGSMGSFGAAAVLLYAAITR
jgi:hypothetical protein